MSIVALAGGVGGAKLAHGLYRALSPDTLTVIVNTGDDFDLYGLRICPDADTVLYTLAGVANSETGWGVAGDTWATFEMLGRYGEETWFRLGDRDLATHLLRTERLHAGQTLSEVLALLRRRLGVRATLLPMTDDPTPTIITTDAGDLAFQDFFVRRHHTDTVRSVRFSGIEQARLPASAQDAIAGARSVIFCPSNPIVSIGPILAVPGMRAALEAATAPRVAVSPIVGGKALRGPADAMLAALGHESSAVGVARLYRGLIDGMLIDHADAAEVPRIEALGMQACVTDTVMGDMADRERLAREALAFAESLRASVTRRESR